MNQQDTICALATPIGGAIAVIRISGIEAFHILSAVFVRDFNANTVNLRMDDKGVYIDLDKFISEENIFIAEKSANDVIFSNIPVETLYPTMEEIEKYSKRNLPKTDDDIRIVKIGELDYTPCCGTHNKYTGEVGIIKVVKTEKGKNGSKVLII